MGNDFNLSNEALEVWKKNVSANSKRISDYQAQYQALSERNNLVQKLFKDTYEQVLSEHEFFADTSLIKSDGAIARYAESNTSKNGGRILENEDAFLMSESDRKVYLELAKQLQISKGLIHPDGTYKEETNTENQLFALKREIVDFTISLMPDGEMKTILDVNKRLFKVYDKVFSAFMGLKPQQDTELPFELENKKDCIEYVENLLSVSSAEMPLGIRLDFSSVEKFLDLELSRKEPFASMSEREYEVTLNTLTDRYITDLREKVLQNLPIDLTNRDKVNEFAQKVFEDCHLIVTNQMQGDLQKIMEGAISDFVRELMANEESAGLEGLDMIDDHMISFMSNEVINTFFSCQSEAYRKDLSEEQAEFFKESKLKNRDGSLMKLYHGSPYDNIKSFQDGSYFTENPAYAQAYAEGKCQKDGTKKPTVYEVYINAKKPFDVNLPECRSIYEDEYVAGGFACGINPYEPSNLYQKSGYPDWNEADNLMEFLLEKGYSYDCILLDEGGTGGYGEPVNSCGVSYLPFHGCEVKSTKELHPQHSPLLQDTQKKEQQKPSASRETKKKEEKTKGDKKVKKDIEH